MTTKRALYFEQGAEEVWTCGREGRMRFFIPDAQLGASRLVPDFPAKIE